MSAGPSMFAGMIKRGIMFDLLGHVNWLAVASASITAFLLGGIWFMLIFKRTYVVALGRENTPPPARSAVSPARGRFSARR